MRKQLVPVLGTWHPFKVASDKIWSTYLNVFWAPAIHSITPNAKVFRNFTLRKLTVFFTQCRLAFPKFKERLETMFLVLNQDPKKTLNPRHHVPREMKNHLINFYYIFNYWLPVVSTLVNYPQIIVKLTF